MNIRSGILCVSALLTLIAPLAARSVEVEMAFGDRIPPFCFPETDTGIELDVMREALAFRGHTLKPVYFPFARIPISFRAGKVDAAMTDGGDDMTPHGGFYGDSAVVYDNVFITLTERNLHIRTPQDLDGLSVISFPGAEKRYPKWLDAVAKTGRFFPQNNQALQVRTLELNRYDVVLSDRTIFKYFTRIESAEQGHPMKPVTEHAFTTVNPLDYRPVFRDSKVRDDFNAGLKHIKQNGRFKAIYQHYSVN